MRWGLAADGRLHGVGVRRSRRIQPERALQVQCEPDQLEVQGVARGPAIAHAAVAVLAFHPSKGPLHTGTHPAEAAIASPQRRVGRMRGAPPGPPHDAVGDAPLSQPLPPRRTVMGLVGLDALLIATDQLIGRYGLVSLGAGEQRLADQPSAGIHGQVRFVTEVIMTLATLWRVLHAPSRSCAVPSPGLTVPLGPSGALTAAATSVAFRSNLTFNSRVKPRGSLISFSPTLVRLIFLAVLQSQSRFLVVEVVETTASARHFFY